MKERLFLCQWTNNGLGIGQIRELKDSSAVANSPPVHGLQRDRLGEWRALITAPSVEVALDIAQRHGLDLWLNEHFETDSPDEPNGREDEICV